MLRTIWSGIGIALMATGSLQAAGQQASNPGAPGASPYRTVLNRYCVTCHNETLKTAELMLDKAAVEDVSAGAAVWEKVVRKLRTGAMPPPGAPRPDKATYDGFATYLETALDRAAAAHPTPGRTAAIHRLNRAEYTNAVRDLLAVEIDGAALLPADDSGAGFDNLADLLTVSPVLMERYLTVASRISRLAVGDRSLRAAAETYRVPSQLLQDDRVSEDLPFGSRGGLAIRHHFPLEGDYDLQIRLQRETNGHIRGLVGEPHQLDVRLDGSRIKQFSVGGERLGAVGLIHTRVGAYYESEGEQSGYEFFGDKALQVRFAAPAGLHMVQVAFLKKTAEPEGLLEYGPRPMEADINNYKGGDPQVESVTITGPFEATGPGDTPSRRKIFICQPTGAEEASETACARQILSTLARRAYRRPVTNQDLQALLSVYQTGRRSGETGGGFEEGIEVALRRILAGPEFLFRIEHDPPGARPDTPYRISDLELASRLSFFLWSSIPDEPLLDLAESGKLKEPAVLAQQVRRMLADPRSKALVDNFAGQWFYLRNIRRLRPDVKEFPEFDEELRLAFAQETELFFESMLRENRPVVDLLSANYTFVNERLAQHYGIPNIYGSSFRRVLLADENRRGLLGQGSILAVTSRANRTSPVLRGKWVVENLLGAPPPPPPPNMPPLQEGGAAAQNRTMRQRMEQHRTNPACATCHSRMDPIGFALDGFDAVGKWRASEGQQPLDLAGALADGTKFNGPVELRKALLSRPDLFVYVVTEKLFTYALGRELDYYDAPAVRKLIREAGPANYTWSSLILGIVKSTPFQMRRSRAS